MADSIKKQIRKVTTLSSSLGELEKKLEPLLDKPLPDTLNSLETLQQAKLQILLPYLINDLIFIYLKTRGIDPKTHPVIAELDRVKQYFGKIKDAEESNKKRTTEVDKAAAGRFIKHAISEARRNLAVSEPIANEAGPSEPRPSTSVPSRITEKMKQREEYLREIAEQSGSEDAGLEIIGDAHEESSFGNASEGREKGKEIDRSRKKTAVVQEITTTAEATPEEESKKRKRPMDPFGPSGEDVPPHTESNDTPQKKKDKKLVAVIDNETSTDSRARSDADTYKKERPSKKKKSKRKTQLSVDKGTS